jgi:hypothetical protein
VRAQFKVLDVRLRSNKVTVTTTTKSSRRNNGMYRSRLSLPNKQSAVGADQNNITEANARAGTPQRIDLRLTD